MELSATQPGIRSISVNSVDFGSAIATVTLCEYGQAVATCTAPAAAAAVVCCSPILLSVARMEASGANEIVASANILRYTLLARSP